MAAFSTLAVIGLTAIQAGLQLKQSQDRADDIVEQGDIAAAKKAKVTKLRAARAQSSFLTSGLTLEGTPMAAIGDIFSTGLEDVDQITTNARKSAKNTISAGRTQALSTLASGVSGSFGGGDIFGGAKVEGSFGATFGSQGSVSRAIEFGDASTQGAIQGFGGFGGQ